MYSRKIVGPKMKPQGTPLITLYSCEDLPSGTPKIESLVGATKNFARKEG